LAATPQTLSAAEVAATAGGGPGGDPRLAAAENTLRELRLIYTEQHPAVVAARNALTEIRNQPAASRSANAANAAAGAAGAGSADTASRSAGSARIPNPVYEQIRLRLIDADAAIGSLERQFREEQTQAEKLEALARGAPQLQAEFMNLDRDYGILRRNYEDLLARRESVQIAGAARTGAERVRLEVVDPPTIPTAPVSPNRILLSSVVLVAGLGAGAALAFLLTQLDRGFYTLSDLRRLGLPVLGSISSADPPARFALTAVTFGSGLVLLLLAFSAVLVGGPNVVGRLAGFVGKLVA
jgi:polysaccharide chain length determinant protein (PEP-CTERM system associated)